MTTLKVAWTSKEGSSEPLWRSVAHFAQFGEVARIDRSLAASTGQLLVTYFDVRSADKALAELETAEIFPPAVHDFRTVAVALTDCRGTATSFSTYGEIAGASVVGEDMLVEFFDIRAAQLAWCSVKGCRPHQGSVPQLPLPFQAAVPEIKQDLQPAQPKLKTWMTAELDESTAGSPEEQGGSTGGGSRRLRERVHFDELAKFDIVADRVFSGLDQRTTVMVRRIPKTCTREELLKVLDECHLEEGFDFFYMPSDKHRRSHCGFAFVNLRRPSDVVLLRDSIQTRLQHRFLSAVMPAVSYARIQGEKELLRHFNDSAVMRDGRKRPVFFNSSNKTWDQSEDRIATVDHDYIQLSSTPAKVALESVDWVFQLPALLEDTLLGA